MHADSLSKGERWKSHGEKIHNNSKQGMFSFSSGDSMEISKGQREGVASKGAVDKAEICSWFPEHPCIKTTDSHKSFSVLHMCAMVWVLRMNAHIW